MQGQFGRGSYLIQHINRQGLYGSFKTQLHGKGRVFFQPFKVGNQGKGRINAQHARGLETSGSVVRRFRALAPLVVPLILSSLVVVEERALAIEARAFNHPGPKTSLIAITEARWEPAARWLLVLTVPLAVALRIVAR